MQAGSSLQSSRRSLSRSAGWLRCFARARVTELRCSSAFHPAVSICSGRQKRNRWGQQPDGRPNRQLPDAQPGDLEERLESFRRSGPLSIVTLPSTFHTEKSQVYACGIGCLLTESRFKV